MEKSQKLRSLFFTAAPFVIFGVYTYFHSRFYMRDQASTAQIALVFLILSGIIVAVQIVIRDRHYFPPAVFFLFVCITAALYLTPEESIMGNTMLRTVYAQPGFALYAVLFLVAAVPPLIGVEPFTYYFAKQNTPSQFWGTRLFKAVNLYINYFWAVIFAVSFALQFLPNAALQTAVPLLLQFGIGLPATGYLQPFLQNRLAYLMQGEPLDFIKSAREAISFMPHAFNKKNAKGLDIVYQFKIIGNENFDGYLEIADGSCTYHDGTHRSPVITIQSPADVWLKIARREISGQEAFLKGLFTVEGDVGYIMKIQQLFGSENRKPAPVNETDTVELNFPKRYYTMKPGQIKKVYAILSSPRRSGASKSEILTRAFLEGCRSAGAEVEAVNLRDKKLNHCIGCYTCWTKTPGVCIHKDDVAEIMKKSNEADLVVYASPLYHFGMYSLLKKYIERTLPKLQPFLVPGHDGKTRHPVREGYKEIMYVVIIGVCGFPEAGHFGAFSANFHFMANTQGDKGMNIVAEIYRPASESLNNPAYQAESDRVLAAARQTGEQVVRTGTIDKKIIDQIARVDIDKKEFMDTANMVWDICIKEGKTLGQLLEQNRQPGKTDGLSETS
jgi:multimeric flavodoxin WrbA/putative sterol carrier protein